MGETIASKEMHEYFDELETRLKAAIKIANIARARGSDPKPVVEIPLAKDLADRVENLIGVEGVAAKIRELEEKMSREESALEIGRQVAEGEVGNFPTKKDAVEAAIRVSMQIGMSFISAYAMCAGEAAVADLSFAAKHAAAVSMGEMLPARRARGPNEPGGLSFGHLSDIVQTSRVSEDPAKIALEVVGAGCMLYDQIWLGSYMSGGVGFTQYATAAYTDDILDNNVYYDVDYINDKYNGAANVGKDNKVKATLEVVKDIATESTLYGIETYEKFPTALEDHFGGSQRATVLAAAAGVATSLATANANAGLSGWYLSMYLHKEAWSVMN